ncbi:MAG: B12-binding domain-containing radical SAM protein, partial [Gemmatimonadota bacterium]|nr:B12-binding domain-containing radical SAM protein [Gemmatimonadota bacterium]
RAYYARSPAPPLSGTLLAGLTPDSVDVRLRHEMVRPIDYETDADIIALSFMDFCAPHAYEVARRFRKRGKIVVAGGKYASTFPQAVMPHVDVTVAGEADRCWPRVVDDLVAGRHRRFYQAPALASLEDIPTPRYDLVESCYAVPVVLEATRGCPFKCTYCQLNIRPAPYRVRPIEDVIRDLTATARLPYHKRKLAMLLDNNLGGDMGYAKELLQEIARLKLWALGVQFAFSCLNDPEFVDLLAAANCRMAFLGLESLNEPSLLAVQKRQNKVSDYERKIMALKERGILTFAGMMLALEEDTPEYYATLPGRLEEVDPSAIFLSISIPIPGTPFHREMDGQGRIFDANLAHYEGDHLVFAPGHVTAAEVFATRKHLMRSFYSWPNVARRWGRLMRAYWRGGPGWAKPFGSLLISYVLFQLSHFQRYHARRRVFPSTVPVVPQRKEPRRRAPAVVGRPTGWTEVREAQVCDPSNANSVVRS